MIEKKNKFYAKKIITSEGKFDSIGEYKYYQQLLLLKKAIELKDRIVAIERQVNFTFVVNDVTIGRYIADFVITFGDGRTEVHDFKNPYVVKGKGKSSPIGQIFAYKKKLMKALFGIDLVVA